MSEHPLPVYLLFFLLLRKHLFALFVHLGGPCAQRCVPVCCAIHRNKAVTEGRSTVARKEDASIFSSRCSIDDSPRDRQHDRQTLSAEITGQKQLHSGHTNRQCNPSPGQQNCIGSAPKTMGTILRARSVCSCVTFDNPTRRIFPSQRSWAKASTSV